MRKIAFVGDRQLGAEIARVVDMLDDDDVPFELVDQGTPRADKLWEAAVLRLRGRLVGGHFKGPIVVVLNEDDDVLWAAIGPTRRQLDEALALVGGAFTN